MLVVEVVRVARASLSGGAHPRAASPDEIGSAVYVVAFGRSVSELGNPRNRRIWDELAAIRDGYGLTRDALVRRVETLFDEIASKVR
jgi:hypothetical protein